MKKVISISCLVFSALISGCAVNQPSVLNVMPPSDTELCCQSYSQLPYVQLNDNETVKFNIDTSSPAASFSEGNSHFAAFKFGERSLDITVSLSSYFYDGSVFAPEVALLSADFKVVKNVKNSDFKVSTSDAFTKSRYNYRLKINTIETPYMVVYTPSELLGKKITTTHPARIRAQELGEPMPMVTDPAYTFQNGGSLELSVELLTLKPVVIQPVSTVVASGVDGVAAGVMDKKATIPAVIQDDTKHYYLKAIEQAAKSKDIKKALALRDEAKALGIAEAETVFIKSMSAN
ncbi:transcriptional regulator [Aeromonas sobria]|uniref:MalM family protein n=1 Tax=Aeromonas sobria TaxID=646 RepID=UPI001119B7AB|nr:MalM family protein [Aeromonas sobria]TNJ25989.1 transcriptional regulator [Aeromonas sobria]